MNRKITQTLLILLVFFCVGLLSGCRESQVIEQIIYDQAAKDVDLQNQIKVSNNDQKNKDQNEKIEEKKKDEDAERERDRERKAPLKGDGDSAQKASQTKHDTQSENKNQAEDKSTGDGPNHGNGDNSSGEADRENENNDQGAGDSDEDADDGEGTGGASDDPNNRPIEDGNGNEVNVPENVDSVTAVGEAAVITQMLGGKGVLAASSSDFLSSGLVQSVFGNEGLSEVQSAWDGDGSSAMSDSSFQELLKVKPDVCFEISGQSSFSESQRAALKEKKIAIVALPEMSSQENVAQAVTVIGDVLGDKSGKGGVNGPKAAKDYNDYCEDLLDEVAGKVGDPVNTLFLSGWDSSAQYTLSSGTKITMQGSGAAVTATREKAGLVSEYLGVGGAENSAVKYNSRGQSFWYVSPLAPKSREMKITGNMASQHARSISLTEVGSGDNKVRLGQESFPAIVVANGEIKDGIENDRNKGGNTSLWKNYGQVSSSSGNVKNGYGFLDENGDIVTTTIRGDYEIYVNPNGVGSWTEGSVESVLESVWAANKFQKVYSDSELKAKIKEFYKEFYRHDLSDSEYEQIMAGQ